MPKGTPKERTSTEKLQAMCKLYSSSQMFHRDRIGHPQYDRMHYRMSLLSQDAARTAYQQLQQELSNGN